MIKGAHTWWQVGEKQDGHGGTLSSFHPSELPQVTTSRCSAHLHLQQLSVHWDCYLSKMKNFPQTRWNISHHFPLYKSRDCHICALYIAEDLESPSDRHKANLKQPTKMHIYWSNAYTQHSSVWVRWKFSATSPFYDKNNEATIFPFCQGSLIFYLWANRNSISHSCKIIKHIRYQWCW